MRSTENAMTTLQATRIGELRDRSNGEVLLPDDAEYDTARRVWNGAIDKRPAVILRCADVSDVVRGVTFAKESGLPLSVRGGGHNIAGSAVCDGGIVVDLSKMRSVAVDPDRRRVTVEGGATLADVDAATQAHGLATPVGINSTTGIAGLTLGGGFGWLSRKHGMTVDNLESAEVVTAAGELIYASATEHPDLFWALRGGSGNFGVVTRFEFRLHSVGPDLLSGLIVYPALQTKSVLRRYRDFLETAPDELAVWVVLRKAPPLPFLAPAVHGQEIVALAFLYAGDPKRGETLIGPVRRLGTPVGEGVGVQPYVSWQQAFDPLLTHGARNYWKSHNLLTLDEGLLDAIATYVEALPSPHCEIFIAALGGATTRPSAKSTAYAHRATRFVMNVHGRWEDPNDDERCVRWARDFFAASAPYASDGVYVNFMTADEGDRVRAAYGSNYDRLVKIKRKYDPTNLFHVNQNIQPV